MCSKFIKEHSFELIKLKQLILIKNMDGIYNMGGTVRHEVEVNLCSGYTCTTLE